ncbi:hypothetical protein MPDQ_007200 [Monascus purpureus]|uniref:Inhibitor I9 domain-containing protein n=1 Tax=Monascus purpureus TaxID=5098 RepID=A0A507QSP8_MONPU|nr:hypothetical protein MPDQ_007200 [Monascus purpureus]BDD60821.1 hypothetical protein MAP00_005919 [Monascus purpureus]
MPLFNVTLKADAPAAELEKAKEQAKANGGTIRHEYTLIKGFTVEYPEDHAGVLETNEHVHVERDGEVRTQ